MFSHSSLLVLRTNKLSFTGLKARPSVSLPFLPPADHLPVCLQCTSHHDIASDTILSSLLPQATSLLLSGLPTPPPWKVTFTVSGEGLWGTHHPELSTLIPYSFPFPLLCQTSVLLKVLHPFLVAQCVSRTHQPSSSSMPVTCSNSTLCSTTSPLFLKLYMLAAASYIHIRAVLIQTHAAL